MTRHALVALALVASGCVIHTRNGRFVLPVPVITGQVPVAVVAAPPPPPAQVVVQPQVPAGAVLATASVPGVPVVDVSFYGVPLAGAQDVVFVLDRSGSMRGVSVGASAQDMGLDRDTAAAVALGGAITSVVGGGRGMPSKMEAAKAELVRTLRAMPDGTRFNVIFFNNSIAPLAPGLMVLDARTRSQAEAFIRNIGPNGSTAAVPALRTAYQSGAARVMLLSDGLPNVGGDAEALLQEARGQMARGVRFDTVAVGLDGNSALLRTIASESGGMSVSR